MSFITPLSNQIHVGRISLCVNKIFNFPLTFFSGLAQEAQAHYENYELSYFSIIERNVTLIFSF